MGSGGVVGGAGLLRRLFEGGKGKCDGVFGGWGVCWLVIGAFVRGGMLRGELGIVCGVLR